MDRTETFETDLLSLLLQWL